MAILRLHVQFFLCCVCWYCGLVLSPDESPDSLSASWDDTGRARSLAWVSGVSGEKGKNGSEKGREVKERNSFLFSPSPLPHLKSPLPQPRRKAWYSGYEILEPQGFLNQHRCPGPFSPFMPFLQTQIKARNQSLRVFLWGLELRLFLACVQLSPPLKLSPRSFEGRGRYTAWSSPAVSGPSVPGVQIVECGTKGEREKKIRRKRGRGLSPLPHPLFVCLFVFFLLTSSLRCPQDMNSWSRIVSRARGKLTRKGKKKKNNNDKNKTTTTTTTKKGASFFIRLRLTRVGPLLWTLRSTIWTP